MPSEVVGSPSAVAGVSWRKRPFWRLPGRAAGQRLLRHDARTTTCWPTERGLERGAVGRVGHRALDLADRLDALDRHRQRAGGGLGRAVVVGGGDLTAYVPAGTSALTVTVASAVPPTSAAG